MPSSRQDIAIQQATERARQLLAEARSAETNTLTANPPLGQTSTKYDRGGAIPPGWQTGWSAPQVITPSKPNGQPAPNPDGPVRFYPQPIGNPSDESSKVAPPDAGVPIKVKKPTTSPRTPKESEQIYRTQPIDSGNPVDSPITPPVKDEKPVTPPGTPVSSEPIYRTQSIDSIAGGDTIASQSTNPPKSEKISKLPNGKFGGYIKISRSPSAFAPQPETPVANKPETTKFEDQSTGVTP